MDYVEVIAQQEVEIAKLKGELLAVKKANSRLRGELRAERREKHKLQKERKEAQHYRNGRRGSKFNG